MGVGENNVIAETLVDRNKIILTTIADQTRFNETVCKGSE